MIKHLKIPMWNRRLLIITPPHDILKATRRFKMGRGLIKQVKEEPPVEGDEAIVYHCDTTGRYILWFGHRKPSINTIIHETNHLTSFILKFVGESASVEKSPYTQEYLFTEVRKALRIKNP